jgi:cell division protein FtsX
LAAALPEGRVRGVADTDAAGEAWAYELRRAGVAIGIVLVLAVAAVAGAAARLTCRHCRNTVEVLIGLGAGVMRVSRAMEGVAVRLTVEATLLAAVALLGSLLLVRRLPALDARLPIAGLHAGELVLLATVPLLAALLGALCARLVTSRQLRAYA